MAGGSGYTPARTVMRSASAMPPTAAAVLALLSAATAWLLDHLGRLPWEAGGDRMLRLM